MWVFPGMYIFEYMRTLAQIGAVNYIVGRCFREKEKLCSRELGSIMSIVHGESQLIGHLKILVYEFLPLLCCHGRFASTCVVPASLPGSPVKAQQIEEARRLLWRNEICSGKSQLICLELFAFI